MQISFNPMEPNTVYYRNRGTLVHNEEMGFGTITGYSQDNRNDCWFEVTLEKPAITWGGYAFVSKTMSPQIDWRVVTEKEYVKGNQNNIRLRGKDEGRCDECLVKCCFGDRIKNSRDYICDWFLQLATGRFWLGNGTYIDNIQLTRNDRGVNLIGGEPLNQEYREGVNYANKSR